jgi:hypothetical protein
MARRGTTWEGDHGKRYIHIKIFVKRDASLLEHMYVRNHWTRKKLQVRGERSWGWSWEGFRDLPGGRDSGVHDMAGHGTYYFKNKNRKISVADKLYLDM